MNRGQIVFGGVLVVLGALFLLDTTGVVDAGSLIGDWWPVLLVAAGALLLLTRPSDVIGPLILMGIGALLLLGTLDIVDVSWWELLWPLALIGSGIWFIVGRVGPANPPSDPADQISIITLFSGRELVSASRAWQGGSVVTLFGGTEIDLRDTALDPAGAGLDVFCAFGAVEITVPDHWRIEVSGLPIFGGWSDKRRPVGPPPTDAPTLTIRALVAFGGLEIKPVARTTII